MDAILSIRQLNKSFGQKKIIDNISFDVFAGEVFGFLGPNGAGKTTTIKMIMGFLSVDSGSIQVAGFDLKKNYEKAMATLGGIVENPEMYKDLSGQVNLEMYARLHDGVTKARIDEVVALVGMQNRIRDKVKKYSLGMKQRLGLAQAILHKPRILILDEPTNGLDPAGIKDLRDILKRLAHEEQVAVFVSSHLLAEMQLMCDRVGIIHQGKLLGVKPIGELMAEASGKAAYRFITPQAEQAVKLLQAASVGLIRLQNDQLIEVEIETEQVPAVAKLLVMNDIAIFGIHKVESSLEEAFMQITGGGVSIA
jgi:ABC-2 type transport system ATP-binding protein